MQSLSNFSKILYKKQFSRNLDNLTPFFSIKYRNEINLKKETSSEDSSFDISFNKNNPDDSASLQNLLLFSTSL